MAYKFIHNGQVLWFETCYKCKTPFAMSNTVHQSAQDRKGEFEFFCPNGHGQVYCKGETEEQKLRRERDRLKQSLAEWQDECRIVNEQKEQAERQAAARKGVITRMKNRAAAGVCPCCSRHFDNLQRHMETKHPKFTAEEVA